MNETILFIMLMGWYVGILSAFIVLIYTFIKKDKKGFNVGIFMMVLYGCTGYVTFFPVTIAFLIFSRFSK